MEPDQHDRRHAPDPPPPRPVPAARTPAVQGGGLPGRLQRRLPNPGAEGQGPYPAPSADQFATGAAKPPDPNEQGFKDTIRANPGEITRIVAKFPTVAEAGFNPDATYTNAAGQTLQGYVWHCHILEHEDNDMMLKYRVIP